MRETWQLSEGFAQDPLVTLPVVRRTESATHRMVDEHGARRRDSTHDVVRRADDQRRNSSVFDDVGDETDGLVAERSVGNKQGEIDLNVG